MKTTLVAAAVAILLAAVVTEVHFRLFLDAYFALWALTAVAIFLGAFITLRASASIAGASAAPVRAERQRAPRQRDNSREPQGSRREAGTAPQASRGASGPRETGNVKWFNRTKGFGFIVRDSGGEIFVHHRNINGSGRQSLRDGQQVSFVVAEGDKGLQAEQVDPTDRG